MQREVSSGVPIIGESTLVYTTVHLIGEKISTLAYTLIALAL